MLIDYIIAMKALAQILSIEKQRRLTVIWINIVAHIHIEHPEVAIVLEIATTAVFSPIFRFCEIAMRHAIETEVL